MNCDVGPLRLTWRSDVEFICLLWNHPYTHEVNMLPTHGLHHGLFKGHLIQYLSQFKETQDHTFKQTTLRLVDL